MNQVEAVRRALEELGKVSHQELVDFIKEKYGAVVKPAVIPILKATVKEEEILAGWRRRAQEAAQNPSLTPGGDQTQAP